MASRSHVEIRPRTTGEILDEAWRLALADAPLLLALSGLFGVPAAVAVLLLCCQPPSEYVLQGLMLPALAAVFLPLTGLGSGACQEALRRRAEGQAPTLSACLRAALAHGLDHAAARALVLTGAVVGSVCLLLPGVAAWVGGATLHPVLAAGEGRLFDALSASRREARRQPGKTAAVVLSRLPLLVLAVLNLHTLVAGGLWIGEHLAGLDVALVGLLLSLDNPVYFVALGLLAWLLLAPHAEAANYLMHVDGRARYEGLDLWYRVRRHFPTPEGAKDKGIRTKDNGQRNKDRGPGLLTFVLIPLSFVLLCRAGGQAAENRLTLLKQVHQDIARVTREVRTAEPYPGSGRWLPQLRKLATQLEGDARAGGPRGRWFSRALDGFAERPRADALRVLADVDQRLALLEESLAQDTTVAAESDNRPAPTREQLKELLPPAPSEEGNETPPSRKQQRQRPVQRDDTDPEAPARPARRGPGIVPAQPSAGFSLLGWLLLAGCFGAVFVVAGVLLWRHWRDFWSGTRLRGPRAVALSLENLVARPEQHTVAGLWRRAEELARAGEHREAVRSLYLAVLLLLHRANFIRLEPTRTNGEYARQLRARESLCEPFGRLTVLFEVQWFSDRGSEPNDYAACRDLAENIRDLASKA